MKVFSEDFPFQCFKVCALLFVIAFIVGIIKYSILGNFVIFTNLSDLPKYERLEL